jgi:hypothetical protein
METSCVSCEVGTGFSITEDDILHSHRQQNLKFYIADAYLCIYSKYSFTRNIILLLE